MSCSSAIRHGLWKGGIVPEPDALWLFLAGFAASAIAYAWYKLR